MKIICKSHGEQDLVFYASKGFIARKCAFCKAEQDLNYYKNRKVKNEKYNVRSGNSRDIEQFFDSFNRRS